MEVKVKSKVYDFQKGMMAALMDPRVENVTFCNRSNDLLIYFKYERDGKSYSEERIEPELVFK